MEAVDYATRKVRVQRLLESCEEAMTKSFSKHEQLYSFADKKTIPETLKSYLESWLSDVTVENDEALKQALEYMDGLPETGTASVLR